ncbi:unnamed protein product [Somion occarium]|uniref:Uncharacterized protein n=1 Tax=Somion occarium TaxID=3059160 RepID=A0ABP1E504_9APHY
MNLLTQKGAEEPRYWTLRSSRGESCLPMLRNTVQIHQRIYEPVRLWLEMPFRTVDSWKLTSDTAMESSTVEVLVDQELKSTNQKLRRKGSFVEAILAGTLLN